MTTIDQHGNAHRPAGAPTGGQFAGKRNTAPAGSLGAGEKRGLTPDDVRTVDYATGVLMGVLEGEGMLNVQTRSVEEAGVTFVEWEIEGYAMGGGEKPRYQYRAPFDERGELLAVQSEFNGHWFDDDQHGDRAAQYRIAINEDRLRLAGVVLGGQANDGGYSGNQFVGALRPNGYVDATDVAKTTRVQIKEAIRWGALPADYSYRVQTRKFAGGQAINITVEGMPDTLHYTEREPGYRHGKGAHAKEVEAALEAIVNQWNQHDVDSMTDYFDVSYYTNVDIPDESMQQFYAEQRELARRKRAAKKDAEAA